MRVGTVACVGGAHVCVCACECVCVGGCGCVNVRMCIRRHSRRNKTGQSVSQSPKLLIGKVRLKQSK